MLTSSSIFMTLYVNKKNSVTNTKPGEVGREKDRVVLSPARTVGGPATGYGLVATELPCPVATKEVPLGSSLSCQNFDLTVIFWPFILFIFFSLPFASSPLGPLLCTWLSHLPASPSVLFSQLPISWPTLGLLQKLFWQLFMCVLFWPRLAIDCLITSQPQSWLALHLVLHHPASCDILLLSPPDSPLILIHAQTTARWGHICGDMSQRSWEVGRGWTLKPYPLSAPEPFSSVPELRILNPLTPIDSGIQPPSEWEP